MFDKKCDRCKNKIKKDFEFCPFCGNSLSSDNDNEDFGILGKNDFIDDNFFPGFNNSFIDKIFNQTMKMMEKQMKNLAEETNNPNKPQRIPINEINPNLNVQFFVNGKKVDFPGMKVPKQPQPKIVPMNREVSKDKAEKLAKFPKKEPESTDANTEEVVEEEMVPPDKLEKLEESPLKEGIIKRQAEKKE